jgi:hypothetical protein
MANAASTLESPEVERISLRDEDDVQKWTRSLDCSEVELRAVVQAIGNDASKVRAYLAGN